MTEQDLRPGQFGPGLQEDVNFRPPVVDDARVVEAAPVKEPTTPAEWVQQNLFSSLFNSILTVVTGTVVLFATYQLLKFVFVSGEWEVVRSNMKAYMTGPFPIEKIWRVWASVYLVAALAGLSLGSMRAVPPRPARTRMLYAAIAVAVVAFLLWAIETTKVLAAIAGLAAIVALGFYAARRVKRSLRRPLIVAWALVFPVVMVLFRAFDGVPPRLWGGFIALNLVAAAFGIFVSFPIGIFLALGRRSSLPAVRTVCVGFIELFRGAPLVGWLIFGQYGLTLLLPPGTRPPVIVRAFIMITLFSSAYVAEIVRGGLQGVDRGQHEAATALGLSVPRMTALIILPQALRSTIPAMIGHFISVFKDTSLLAAIELTDLLQAARRSASSLEFLGDIKEALLFAALVFWVVAFSMSRWSQRLELRLGVGER